MDAIERKNREMVRAIVTGKAKSNGEAYAMSRGKKTHTRSDVTLASRVLQKVDVQEYMQEMRQKYLARADEAFEKQWELANQPTTPPHVKNAIWSETQDRAGLGKVELSFTKHQHDHKYPELMMTREQVLEMLDEPAQYSRQKEGSLKGGMLEPTIENE